MTDAIYPLQDLRAVTVHNANVTPRPIRPPLGAPLTLKTNPSALVSGNEGDLPSAQGLGLELQHSISQGSDVSPKTERLPSFRQISKIADAAGTEATRPVAFPPPPPPVSYAPPALSHQSSSAPSHQSFSHGQASPASAFGFLPQASPASNYGDYYYPNPTSPSASFSGASIYHSRRPSQPLPYSNGGAPPPLPSMLTNSSSGESWSHHSSLSEGQATNHISTAQTTPIESAAVPMDLNNRPKIPLLPNSQLPPQPEPTHHHPGPWICDFPGCTAAPFPTQYLLNSHATSHSSSRPHYCPVADCPRSQGGKGFKRKNEMIRHGLTHETPGYVCPFCPDERGHKYPRPDNLQRHVRVHHVDKDRDDPALREVLSQRPAGMVAGAARRGSAGGLEGRTGSKGRGRKRRTTGP